MAWYLIQVSNNGLKGEKMSNLDYIEVLKNHNAWRRNNDEKNPIAMGNPTEIGIAIDEVIKLAEVGSEAMKMLNKFANAPRETRERRFARLCVDNLNSFNKGENNE